MKNTIFLLLFLFFSITILTQELEDNEAKTAEEKTTEENKEPVDKNVFIKIDEETKKVYINTELVASEKMLEVFACTAEGPTHETVFVIEPIGAKLHQALQNLKLNEPIHWQYPLKNGFELSMGDKVALKVFWEGQKEEDAIFAEDLLSYMGTEAPMFLRGWSFKGDQITKNGKSSPSPYSEFTLINKGRNNSPVSLLLNPTNFVELSDPEFTIAKKYLPLLKKLNDPNKTKGQIIISPVTEKDLMAWNLKRYPEHQENLQKGLEIAKNIDQLKARFHLEFRQKVLDLITRATAENLDQAKQDKLITEHKLLSAKTEELLAKINYLYHQLFKIQYDVLHSYYQNSSDQETKSFFELYVYQLSSFIEKEKEHILAATEFNVKRMEAQQNQDEAGVWQNGWLGSKHQTLAENQILLFRQLNLQSEMDRESKRLEEKETKENQLVFDTLTKSLERNKLEKHFLQLLAESYLARAQYFEELSKKKVELTEQIPALTEYKKKQLQAVLAKADMILFGLTNRLKVLEEYYRTDKRDKEYYEEKIKEAKENINKLQKTKEDISQRLQNGLADQTDWTIYAKEFSDLLEP